jgi:hypothetical protein
MQDTTHKEGLSTGLRLVPKRDLLRFRDKSNDDLDIAALIPNSVLDTCKNPNEAINYHENKKTKLKKQQVVIAAPLFSHYNLKNKNVLNQPVYFFDYSDDYYNFVYYDIRKNGIGRLFPGDLDETPFFINDIDVETLMIRYKVNAYQYGLGFSDKKILKNKIPILPSVYKVDFFINNVNFAEDAVKQRFIPNTIKRMCDIQEYALMHLVTYSYLTFDEYSKSFNQWKKLEKC